MEVAGWFVGPFMSEIIKACSDYLKDQIRLQTDMKEELERLQENHPKIKAVVFAANQAQISDQNQGLNEWIWQLRDALDEVNDALDELEYMKHKEQLSKNTEEAKLIKNKKLRKVRSMMKSMKKKLAKIGKRDPNLKRLEKAVQKLDKISADVTPFFLLLESAKQEQKEQEVDFYKTRQTGSLPTTNVLFGRGEAKEYVTQWLKKLSNEHQDRNISLLSIVGHGGMGKTTLLQHVYKDEITEEFDLKMWVCVSNNFDMKTVIEHMLESLYKKKPDVDSLDALQDMLRIAVGSKKFLLILDDIWVEEENQDINKWEKVFAPLAYGKIGSGILFREDTNRLANLVASPIASPCVHVDLEYGACESPLVGVLSDVSVAIEDVMNSFDLDVVVVDSLVTLVELVNKQFVDVFVSFISNEILKAQLVVNSESICVDQNDWLEEDFNGPEEDARELCNLNVNRIVDKAFGLGRDKRRRRKSKRK
ncbi:Putative disease resistance protein RGA4 [Dendrobium catenatum]|uniref:Disease resistance protein RGA4 n=1 Tax=Dendrobium catenatum TaxID=906689 RepID=A0A2I0WD55_9ASPA|nr:Putative disease resistance protein RGA4 [Dendrobium catenatum]